MKTLITSVCAVTALTTLAGCSLINWVSKDDTEQTEGQVGSLVTDWSQAEYGDSDLEALTNDDTLLLTDEAERAAWLATLPKELDGAPVTEVDLSENLLVVGGYHKCMEQGRVVAEPDRATVRFTTYIAPEDRNTNCGWAPYTVEVWQVPLSELG
ncbi:hypothetical protein [Nocardioides speluncae]|uniref:hypothetical protein n=1 Tax=Nocardioides speluncae TaxID=2670337 RepID=UPI000D69C94A|nr:hypothetical protein [Nocardioides speluncae]